MDVVTPARPALRKCIVLDLDGTLWGGVLGEVGPAGVALGPDGDGRPYLAFQHALRDLAEKGMLLAVASKNDYAEAAAAIETHEHMAIRDYIVSVKIGWGAKAASIVEIANELGLGLDAMAFLDDSPFERAAVRAALPMVLTPDLPASPYEYVAALHRVPELSPTAVTPEAAARVNSYRLRSRRAEMARECPVEDVNARLHTRLWVEDAASLDRVAELSQRTNQFNLASGRYDAEALALLARDERHRVFQVRVADDLEDFGVVGAGVIACDGDSWHLREFVLSCRVLARRLESAALWAIAVRARESGARWLKGEFVETPRNRGVAGGYYPDHGFERAGGNGDRSLWVLDLAGGLPASPPGIETNRWGVPNKECA